MNKVIDTVTKKDTYVTTVNDTFPYNVFLYWLEDSLMGDSYENAIPLSHSASVFSVMYSPFLSKDDFILKQIPYDVERFKYKDNELQIGIPNGVQPYVYRINRFNNQKDRFMGTKTKNLGTFKCYKNEKVPNVKSWRNEPKLHNYPYTYGYIMDGICEPIEIRYHLCPLNEDLSTPLWVRIALNINSDYGYFIRGYRGDENAIMEDFIVNTNKELPCSSNQYAQWIATNKSQMEQRVVNSGVGSLITGASAGATIGTMIMPGVGTAVGAALGASLMNAVSGEITNQMNKATERDMRNLPNSLTSRGGDLVYGINKMGKAVKHIRYRQSDTYMEKLGDFFAMFGYKQNKIIDLENDVIYSKRSRHYYNYIKTIGANIDSKGIPKEHLDEIKAIHNKGVTIWHIDREGVVVGDYSKDNIEEIWYS